MKRISTLLLMLASVTLAVQCNGKKETEQVSSSKNNKAISKELLSEGFNLLETQCFSCHSPTGNHDSRIAPPMFAIKKHYLKKFPEEAEFVHQMVAFVDNPTKEKAIMKGAIEKFGVMPKMGFSEAQIIAMATYMYQNPIEKPEWFEEHYEKEKAKHHQEKSKIGYKQQGKEYALATKSVLGKNLIGAINSKGTAEALSFCNSRAIPLTDSMATHLSVGIKRVSDKPRNPANMANEEELTVITQMKKQLEESGKAEAQLAKSSETVTGYYPIITNAMCLQCHGSKNDDITPEVTQRIAELYPEDKATAYGQNELRGIWVVDMPKTK